MLQMEDKTFQDLRERSLMQWLSDMEAHSDPLVTGGVRLCREYIQSLQDQILQLESANHLKNEYLKKLSARKK